ncbi:recombination protein RecR [candidate division KSB1 bacterium]|nr:MAG: recombination protein RecR [candidate division KSB1 bacterium]
MSLDVSKFSPSLERLVERIAKLPGLGRKSAARLALHILRQPDEDARELAQAILDVKSKIHLCRICSNFTEEETCSICVDMRRDHTLICVVETPSDVLRLERTGSFRGLYHVLGGVLSPLDGISPDDLRIAELVERVKDGTVREVILAINPTTDGDTTSLYLLRVLKERNVMVSRIARGIPIGAELEHVDEVTLASALEARTKMQ